MSQLPSADRHRGPEKGFQRRFQRYQVALNGTVQWGEHTSTCQVLSVCRGGAFVQGMDPALAQRLIPGTALALSLDSVADKSLGPLVLSGQATHFLEGGVGVRFDTMTDDRALQLDDMVRQQESASGAPDRGRMTPPPDRKQAALAALQRIEDESVDSLLEALLHGIEDHFWERAEQSGSNSEKTQVSEYAATLSRLRNTTDLTAQLRTLIEGGAIKSGCPNGSAKTGLDIPAELELIDQEEFEAWLEKSALVNQIEYDQGPVLRILRSQALTAFGHDGSPPLQPRALADATDRLLDSAGLPHRAKSLGFRALREFLPPLLNRFYVDLTQAWELAGIHPASLDAAQPADGQDGQGGAPRTGSQPIAAGTLGDGLPSGLPEAADQSQPLTREDASRALLRLSPEALLKTRQSGVPPEEQAAALLAPALGTDNGRPVDAWVLERLKTAERVLTHLSDTARGSPRLQDWIERLAPQILAAAIANPGFFQSPGHPLLDLIDQLQGLANFVPAAGADADPQIERAVEQVLTETTALDALDPDALTPAVRRLTLVTTRQSKQFQTKVARLLERLEGRDQLREARAQVQQSLNQILSGRQVHRAVLELVKVWTRLLELLFLREGGQGELWSRSLATLRHAVVLCSRDTNAETVTQPAAQALLTDVGNGLAYLGFDPYLRRKLEGGLESAMQQVRTGSTRHEDFQPYRAVQQADSETAERAAPDDVDPLAWRQALTQVDRFKIGSLLHFQDEDGERSARLIWRSRDGSEIALVDTVSRNLRNVGRPDLALGVCRNRVTLQVLPEVELAERATDATLEEMHGQIDDHRRRESLTGLLNRQQFTGRVTRLLAAPGGGNRLHAVGFLELDHVETLSASCGLDAVSKLMRAIAVVLENILGGDDTAAFLGDRRFAFLVSVEDEREIEALGERLRSEVLGLGFHWQGIHFPVTGSVGLVLASSAQETPEGLLSAADIACGSARESGGNNVVLFRREDDLAGKTRERMIRLVAAESAINEGRFRLRAQGIVPIAQRSDLKPHWEILLSVYDRQRKFLPLGEFIATAEAFNLMAKVDRAVIATTLAWIHDHPAECLRLGSFAINLSGQSVANPGFLDFVREQVERFRISPDNLSFEITETAAVASLDQAVAVTQGIKDIGCKVALDDFGTGLASYTYLKRLPVDYLKIDGSFVKDMLENPDDVAIVRSINEVAHFMGKHTVAEFVQTRAIRDHLAELGVDFAQGYAIHRPQFLDQL